MKNKNEKRKSKMKTIKVADRVETIHGQKTVGVVRVVSPQLTGTNMGLSVKTDGGETVSLNPNNVKVVGFENLIGDGPSGFDYWQDTKWCC